MTGSQCLAFRHGEFTTIWTSLDDDIMRFISKSPENIAAGDCIKHRLGAFFTPNLLCLFLYRIAHYLFVRRWRRCAAMLSRLNMMLHKANIPAQSCIGPACHLPHPAGVTFCGVAGRGLTLYSLAVCCPLEPFADGGVEWGPRLGDNVLVGGHAVVLGEVVVGSGTKIAFNSRLTQNAPASAIVISRASRLTSQTRGSERTLVCL